MEHLIKPITSPKAGRKQYFLFFLYEYSFSQAYTWGNIAFWGGGFVSGIITHKTLGDVYCYTDDLNKRDLLSVFDRKVGKSI